MKWLVAPVKTTILDKITITAEDTFYISYGSLNWINFNFSEMVFTVYSKKDNVYYNLIVDTNNKEATAKTLMEKTTKIRNSFSFAYLFETIFYGWFIGLRILINTIMD